MINQEHIWLGVGLAGQLCFSSRFLVQWIASEKAKRSVVPEAFWYFSILGGLTLLSYAVFKGDPVFIIGQASGLFIYLRNLYFVKSRPEKGDQTGCTGEKKYVAENEPNGLCEPGAPDEHEEPEQGYGGKAVAVMVGGADGCRPLRETSHSH